MRFKEGHGCWNGKIDPGRSDAVQSPGTCEHGFQPALRNKHHVIFATG
jgi:hypothetical protein